MRNYLADMDTAIDTAAPGLANAAAPLIATDLVKRLRAQDPDLLAGWLDVRAAAILADAIERRRQARLAADRQAAVT